MNGYFSEILRIKADEYSCEVNDLLIEDAVKYMTSNTVQFKMITFGFSTLIIGETSIISEIKERVSDVNNIQLFDAPSLCIIDSVLHKNDLSLSEIYDFFIPSQNISESSKNFKDYEIKRIEKEDIQKIQNKERYDNALCLDDYVSMNEMAYVALASGEIASIAGTSSNTKEMWWIGVDTMPSYRRRGLASFLVNKLACDVIKMGKLPVYPTWYSNISSRLTAIKAGFLPGYVEIECQ